jgi:hypothetical protein
MAMIATVSSTPAYVRLRDRVLVVIAILVFDDRFS